MKRIAHIRIWVFISILGYLIPLGTAAQEKASPTPVKTRITLSYFVDNNNTSMVSARLSHKLNRRNVYDQGIELSLFLNEISDENLLAKEVTNKRGIAEFYLTERFQEIQDTLLNYKFYVVFNGNDSLKNKTSSLDIGKANLEMNLIEEDSIKYIEAHLTGVVDDTLRSIENEDLKFFVQRTFSQLPFGGKYTSTDKNGLVKIEFPNDIPGDESGRVEIVVKLVDHDDYGNIEKMKEANWGIPLVINNSELKGELWSDRYNAPFVLVFISLAVIIGVWFTLGYLVWRLIQIKRIGNKLS